MWTLLSIAAVIAVLFLCRSLFRRLGADRIDAIAEKRRAGSLLVTQGDFVDGNRHLAVVMALTSQALFYENTDMEASIELEWVSEVEYDTRVGTGARIEDGGVLRIRCYSRCFEFVLPGDAVARWQAALPARNGEAAAVASETTLYVAPAAV
jgi:hypothetical protein